MATRLPEFKMRQMARRGGADITSLAAAYKSQSDALTNQYQTEFDKYQKAVAEKMAPYQAQLEQYKSVLEPQYQSALSAYNQKLDAYQKQLADISANPMAEVTTMQAVQVKRLKAKGQSTYVTEMRPVTDYVAKELPKFTEVAPEVPSAPVAPQIEEFNAENIESKRKQLGMDYSRELSERKSSRRSAVQRKSRTLLGGVQA